MSIRFKLNENVPQHKQQTQWTITPMFQSFYLSLGFTVEALYIPSCNDSSQTLMLSV